MAHLPEPLAREPADEALMDLALEEARAAFDEDEVPIGAVIVQPDPAGPPPAGGGHRVLARAHNRPRALSDPTAHAELLAVRAAAQALGYQRLEGCTVYTTVEPCLMCAGALLHARVARVVFGVRDPKFGGVVSLSRLFDIEGANHRVLHTEGVRADDARELLQSFFRSKR